MKNDLMQFLEVIKCLIKYKVLFGLVVLGVGLNIAQEFFPTKGWIQCFQLIGIIVIAAICAVILLTDKNGKKYIKKIAMFSFLWFASCIILVDFKKFDFELFVCIISSYEYIFLGCLIPDFVSKVENEKDKKIRELEDRIVLLEEKL